jgi:hypothetical protein
MLDQERIQQRLETLWDATHELSLRAPNRRRSNHAQPVRDPQDMNVDRDARFPMGKDANRVRSLWADIGESKELGLRHRDISPELGDNHSRRVSNAYGL